MIYSLSVEEKRHGYILLESPDELPQDIIVVRIEDLDFQVERGDVLHVDIQQTSEGAIQVTVIGKDEKERHRRASKRSLYEKIKGRLEKK